MMTEHAIELHQEDAQIFVPDGVAEDAALARTTHLAVGAHQDDLEIMAIDGILQCFKRSERWFTGVVVTDGKGSPRKDTYADYDDDAMGKVRTEEQKKAAVLGEFSAQILLDFPSSIVKERTNEDVVQDLVALFRSCRPEIVYTHNLADKHSTHVAVALDVIAALRQLPVEEQPAALYGCEVWRDLDWLVDDFKVSFDVSEHQDLQAALLSVFDSQIAGGKHYDLAAMGRRRAHATFSESHATDEAEGFVFAMDLTPLIRSAELTPAGYVAGLIHNFTNDVVRRIDGLNRL